MSESSTDDEVVCVYNIFFQHETLKLLPPSLASLLACATKNYFFQNDFQSLSVTACITNYFLDHSLTTMYRKPSDHTDDREGGGTRLRMSSKIQFFQKDRLKAAWRYLFTLESCLNVPGT